MRDDLEHVLGEIFVKGCITSFVDNDHFHILATAAMQNDRTLIFP